MTSTHEHQLDRRERLTGVRGQGSFVQMLPFGRTAAIKPEDTCAYRLAGWQANTHRR